MCPRIPLGVTTSPYTGFLHTRDSTKVITLSGADLRKNTYYKQECIPVGCVPPARNRTASVGGGSSLTETPWTETPPRPPWTETSPKQKPLDRDPPGQRPPQQRSFWTETPQTETPLNRDLPWTETLLDQDPLDRDPPGQRPPNRDPSGQRPPRQTPP